MSFDNYKARIKDNRHQYYDVRKIDSTCRSHGSCPYCARGRQHKYMIQEKDAMSQIHEYFCYRR